MVRAYLSVPLKLSGLVQEDVFRKNVQGTVTAGNRFLTAPNDFLLTFSLAVIDSTTNDYHFLLKTLLV